MSGKTAENDSSDTKYMEKFVMKKKSVTLIIRLQVLLFYTCSFHTSYVVRRSCQLTASFSLQSLLHLQCLPPRVASSDYGISESRENVIKKET